MDWAKAFHLLLLLNIFGSSYASFETCDQTINIAGQALKLQSPGFADGFGYLPGSSCRYTIVAPVDYQIRASCSINTVDPSKGSCSTDRFYFATDVSSSTETGQFRTKQQPQHDTKQ